MISHLLQSKVSGNITVYGAIGQGKSDVASIAAEHLMQCQARLFVVNAAQVMAFIRPREREMEFIGYCEPHNLRGLLAQFLCLAGSAMISGVRAISLRFRRFISVTPEILKSHWIANYESLYRYAFRILGDRHEAEDVMQDTILALIQRHQELAVSDNEFVLYCRAVLRNRCLDRFRKRKPISLDIVPEIATEPRRSNNIAVIEFMGQLIEKLPPRQREVMTKYLSGESTVSIADALSVSEATVRSLRRHAIRFLSEKLQEVGDE